MLYSACIRGQDQITTVASYILLVSYLHSVGVERKLSFFTCRFMLSEGKDLKKVYLWYTYESDHKNGRPLNQLYVDDPVTLVLISTNVDRKSRERSMNIRRYTSSSTQDIS